jgi:hypothetical protein
MLLVRIITQQYKDSLTLRYPPNIDIQLVFQFDSLGRLLDIIIDVDY